MKVAIAERDIVLDTGAVLPLVVLQEREGAGPFFQAYCTARREPVKTTSPGAFIGNALNALTRSLSDGQSCLVDKDADGKFDHALVVAAGGDLERVHYPITPVGYERLNDEPISSDDEVRIRLTGVSKARAKFRIDIVQRGFTQEFDTIHYGGRVVALRRYSSPIDGKMPFVVRLYGADFAIQSADAAQKTVTLSWPATAPHVRHVLPELIEYR